MGRSEYSSLIYDRHPLYVHYITFAIEEYLNFIFTCLSFPQDIT